MSELVYRHHMQRGRRVISAVACWWLVAGCSGSDSGPATSTEPSIIASTAPSSPTLVPVETSSAPVDADADMTLSVDVMVAVQAAGESAGRQVELSASVDPAALSDSDVFGSFASCSGARRSFGSYSVLVSSTDGPVSAVSIFTETPVPAGGIYDADVRVELSSGQIESAIGTATIDPDFRSGSFMAFTSEGGSLSGTFECIGGAVQSAPLEIADSDDDVLETTEVVALMRRGDAERVVGLAVDATRSPSVTIECSSVTGGADPSLVYVDGDQSVGAISSFELTSGDNPSMWMQVGGQRYEFDAVSVDVENPPTAGTFSATVDGLSVDGAFRCA